MKRIALIGCGAVAVGGHVPAVLRHPSFELAAVCDVRREQADRIARELGGVPVYEDWRVLLDRERLDAAVLALPPEASPDAVIACLEHGLPVLDEKPLAATLDEGRRVADAVTRTQGVYQIGFVLRYADWVREVGRFSRAVGAPARTRVSVFDERLDRSDGEHLGRIQGFLANSSAMTHEGSHIVDYASLWNPSPWASIRAEARRTSADFLGPNLWDVSIRSADDSLLEIRIGWLQEDLPRSAVVVEGPHGRLDLDLSTGSGRWSLRGESGELSVPPLAPEWDRQYAAFAQAVERGRAEISTVDDGLRALETTIAAETSARTGMVVERMRVA